MQPAERLKAAFAGEMPDRVPVMPKIWVDLGARLTGTAIERVIEEPGTAMRVLVDAALAVGADGTRQFLFPARRTRCDEGRLFEVDAAGRRIGAIDWRGGLMTRLDRIEDFRLDDPEWTAFHTSWTHDSPFVAGMADARRIAVPEADFYRSHGYGDLLRAMQQHAGDRVGLCGDCDSATLAFHASFRGLERALLDLVDDPPLVHAVMEKGERFAVERGKFNIDAGLRILRLNDSIANMSVISPRQFQEFIFPHIKTVCDELHGYCPEVKIYCHVCGNVLPVIALLVRTGLDCIGPLDPLGGFSVADARRAAGDAMLLMGGVNTLSFVHSGPQQVRAEALRCIEEGGANDRFILGSGCALPRDSRPANIRALAEAAEAYASDAGGKGIVQ